MRVQYREEMGMEGQENRRKWHLVRDIPVGVIATLAVQTVVGVWFFSGELRAFSFKLDLALQQIAEFKADRYTKDDARRDQQLIFQVMEQFRQSDKELERRVLSCEQHTIANGGGKR